MDILQELKEARGGVSVFGPDGANLGGLYDLAAAEIERLRRALKEQRQERNDLLREVSGNNFHSTHL